GGSSGSDTVSYAYATAGETINLTTGTAIGGDGTDTLTNFDNAVGSSFADTITGDSNINSLYGGDGDDTLFGGGGGADFLSGGNGNDVLVFDNLNMILSGGADDDTMRISSLSTVDLVALSTSNFSGIETIDMQTDTGANTLNINATDVLSMSDTIDTLFITGGSNDVVNDSTSAGWALQGTATINSINYNIYTMTSATLYVDQDINQIGLTT
ncbi:MAG: calcium-binding protein, partial [Gammaproteobacteria bacterium]